MAKSLRKSINLKCRECIYDPAGGAGGTWRQQVEACTSFSCPLWDVRPVSRPKLDADDDNLNDNQGDLP